MNKNHHYFKGYECNQPANIQDTSSLIKQYCPDQNPRHIRPARDQKHYQLLQKEEYQRVKGYHCTIIETKMHLFCGVFDHMALDPGRTLFEVPTPVTASECQQMATTRQFRTPNGRLYRLTLNADNIITYLKSGQVYYESGELQCVGHSIMMDQMQMTDIVSSSQVRVRIQEEEFFIDKAEVVTAVLSEKRLPCSAPEEHCVVLPDTYVWKYDQNHCPLAFNRKFK